MRTKVGRMCHRIKLQKPSGDTDEFANTKDEWVDFAEVWADIAPISGREYFAAEQSVSETQFKIYIRYLDGVTPKMRVVYQNKTFEILAVLGTRENRMTTLMAKELI